MTFIFACFLFCIFLETFISAGLFFVKSCQIGLLFSFASSWTRFILWSITGFRLNSHFSNCWFVLSNFLLVLHWISSVHSPGVPFLSVVIGVLLSLRASHILLQFVLLLLACFYLGICSSISLVQMVLWPKKFVKFAISITKCSSIWQWKVPNDSWPHIAHFLLKLTI